MNYSEILAQAKEGIIEQKTIIAIATELASNQHQTDTYTLLHILGRAEARQYEDLVRPYLDYKDDTVIAALALRILCIYWNLVDKYLDILIERVCGLDWDTENWIQLGAFSIAGEYIHMGNINKDILECLLAECRESSNKVIRQSAYTALCHAVGLDHMATIEEVNQFILNQQVNPEILDKVNQMLNSI